MQIGFSKKISENLLEDVFQILLKNIIIEKKVKIAKFGTFILRKKNQRVGRNPKTKEEKIISERNVILFKPSKELKQLMKMVKEKKIKLLNIFAYASFSFFK